VRAPPITNGGRPAAARAEPLRLPRRVRGHAERAAAAPRGRGILLPRLLLPCVARALSLVFASSAHSLCGVSRSYRAFCSCCERKWQWRSGWPRGEWRRGGARQEDASRGASLTAGNCFLLSFHYCNRLLSERVARLANYSVNLEASAILGVISAYSRRC
jgi:hypothetical protein